MNTNQHWFQQSVFCQVSLKSSKLSLTQVKSCESSHIFITYLKLITIKQQIKWESLHTANELHSLHAVSEQDMRCNKILLTINKMLNVCVPNYSEDMKADVSILFSLV